MTTGLSGVWARTKDWVIAVGVAATLLVTALAEDHSATDLSPVGYALVAASGLALIGRRRTPLPVLVITGLCVAGYNAVGFEVPAVGYLFAVYAAVRAGHRLVTVLTSVALLILLPLLASEVSRPRDPGPLSRNDCRPRLRWGL